MPLPMLPRPIKDASMVFSRLSGGDELQRVQCATNRHSRAAYKRTEPGTLPASQVRHKVGWMRRGLGWVEELSRQRAALRGAKGERLVRESGRCLLAYSGKNSAGQFTNFFVPNARGCAKP